MALYELKQINGIQELDLFYRFILLVFVHKGSHVSSARILWDC